MSITGKKTFSAGRFFGVNNVTNPTPARIILPQDMSVDFKRSTKMLYGENQFASAIAAGEMTVSGKVTMGTTNARIFTDMIFSNPGTTGQIMLQNQEAATLATGSYTAANGATFKTDLGIREAVTGIVFTRVASAPAVGQYSVNTTTGVYTFATADISRSLLFTYTFTNTTTGESVILTNPAMGPTSSFTAVMNFFYGAEQDVLTLNNAIATDAGIATKMGDYAKPTMGFDAATDSNDILGTFSFAQAA